MTQSQALTILKTGANVFLTGEPGSGKTHTTNEYIAYLRSRGIEPAITASTGIAATHIGGITIHSWSGIGIKPHLTEKDLHKIANTKHIFKRIKNTHVLIIDEVSMLPPNTVSMVDAICREVRQSQEPFGGMQVVLVGDFFQLPPVTRTVPGQDEQQHFWDEPIARFAYDSRSWREANFTVCYLSEQHRQDDDNFLALLSAMRRNAFTSDHLEYIKTRTVGLSGGPTGAPKLFSHNADVDRVNEEILSRLPGEVREFNMSSDGPEPLVMALMRGCLSPPKLALKIKTAVMFTKNNPKEGYTNGMLGTVEGFNVQNNHYPIVVTRDGRRICVEPMDWAIEEEGETRARITQLPLRLAWAITVHKSQGMSLDEAVMDLGSVFEFGQGYVALSRVRRLSGLHLLGWNDRAFQVHPEVLAKDLEFRESSEQAAISLETVSAEEQKEREEQFIRVCGGTIASSETSSRKPAAKKSASSSRSSHEEQTLEHIRAGKTIATTAELCGWTEGTILSHLESLGKQGKLSIEDIRHLIEGNRDLFTEIEQAFRELGQEKLAPIFHKFEGAHSYETIRLGRILFDLSNSSQK